MPGLRPRPALNRVEDELPLGRGGPLCRRALQEVTDENACAKLRPREARESLRDREPLRPLRQPKEREAKEREAKEAKEREAKELEAKEREAKERGPLREAEPPRDGLSFRPEVRAADLRSRLGPEAEYAEDIFEAAMRTEQRGRPLRLCEGDVTPRMRSVLVDWLVEVHLKFQLRPETLFLAVSILDRYIALVDQPRNRLQLVGVTALLVASKYEEVFAPELRDFVVVTDRAYTREELLQCEVQVLTTLKWRITLPSPLTFLNRLMLLEGVQASRDHYFLAQYFAELALPDVRFVKLAPSLIASAALLLANKVLKASPSWPRSVAACVPYTEAEVKALAKQFVELLGADSAVKRKFSGRSFYQVAKLIA